VARVHGRRPFVRGVKRQTSWIGAADQGFILVPTTARVVVGSFPIDTSGFERPTLIRTRGTIIHSPEVLTADLEYHGAWGLGFVSDQAFAIGATALPGPFDEADWGGWLAHGYFGMKYDLTSDIGRIIVSENILVDSKAMRKAGQNDTLILMAESQSGAFDIAMHLRTLWKVS